VPWGLENKLKIGKKSSRYKYRNFPTNKKAVRKGRQDTRSCASPSSFQCAIGPYSGTSNADDRAGWGLKADTCRPQHGRNHSTKRGARVQRRAAMKSSCSRRGYASEDALVTIGSTSEIVWNLQRKRMWKLLALLK